MLVRNGRMKSSLIVPMAFLLLVCLTACNNNSSQNSLKNIGQWPEPTSESQPWARWWWMGGAVDKENLTFLMNEYKEAGIGGLKIAPIYGAKGFENKFCKYRLSPI